MTGIKVSLKKLEDRSYDILIGRRCLDMLPSALAERGIKGAPFIITDENVRKYWAENIKEILRKSCPEVSLLSIPAGENQKKLSTIEDLARELVSKKADRSSLLVAVGGGVIGDITGFLASVFLRGIPFINIPTTLLAQVDSSVGGKTGVDLPEGKNLIGAFYQPRFVFADMEFLLSLPYEEFLNGMAEVIKYGVILDEKFFSFLEANAGKILNRDPGPLTRIVCRCCELKRDVVEEDEKEAGLRRILNFGHSIGHALESASNYGIKHGWAVSVGMVAACHVSAEMGVLSPDEVKRVERVVGVFGLPVRIPASFEPEEIIAGLSSDKKRVGSDFHWILPEKIGKARSFTGVPEDMVARVLKKLRN